MLVAISIRCKSTLFGFCALQIETPALASDVPRSSVHRPLQPLQHYVRLRPISTRELAFHYEYHTNTHRPLLPDAYRLRTGRGD